MNAEKLIQKGVRKHFDGQKVFFDVDSLNEHYNDLLLHNSDIVKIEDGDYIALEDVNFDHATANEVAREEEVSYELSEEGTEDIVSTLTPEEADVLIKKMNEDFPVWVNPEIADIEVVVTEETLADNPEFVEAGIEVGEIITVAAEEEVVAPVTTKKKRRK